jgi:hypothetical protein
MRLIVFLIVILAPLMVRAQTPPFANCPTLAPIPVVSFKPAAMQPIINAETAFDVGMNTVIRNAVTVAGQVQIKAIDSAFNSILKNMIEVSQSQKQSEIEIDREFQKMKLAYDSELERQREMLDNMLFPGDPAMLPKEDETEAADYAVLSDRLLGNSNPSTGLLTEPPTRSQVARSVCAAGGFGQLDSFSTEFDGNEHFFVEARCSGFSGFVNVESPSYKFIKQMCSAGKSLQYMTSKKVLAKARDNKNRRSQKIVTNIQAVSNIAAKAKQSIDKHYDIFCSENDLNNGLCDSTSMSPNADLDAYVFLYPSGYVGEANRSDEYSTMYTYSPVESLAAYQYIEHLTGTLFVTPPTQREMKLNNGSRYLAAYKQLVSVMGLSADALLFSAQQREPVNSVGLVMGNLDMLNYIVTKSSLPDNVTVLRSASANGKLVEMQKQMALQQQIRMLLLHQKDKMRQLSAAEAALSSTKAALASGL